MTLDSRLLTRDSYNGLLSGSHAIARGALEANVRFASSYPGEPVTEVATGLEAVAKAKPDSGLHFEWSLNESVAFEKVFAASWTGVRSLVSMKHVGLNVAMDAFRTMAEKESRGGLLIVIGTDPGPESSQNSQDNRSVIADSNLLTLEAANSQECLEMARLGVELSEKYRIPVVLSVNQIVAEGSTPVEFGILQRSHTKREFVVERERQYVTSVPTYSADVRKRRELIARIAATEESFLYERLGAEGAQGIICSNLLSCQVEEVLEEAGLSQIPRIRLKTFSPLPDNILAEFMRDRRRVLVLEEQMPFLETALMALAQRKGIDVEISGKISGGFTPYKAGVIDKTVAHRAIAEFLADGVGHSQEVPPEDSAFQEARQLIMPRALTFCPGCPHAPTHFALNHEYDEASDVWRKREAMIRSADIGCYGSLPSFLGMAELKFHMGGGFGLAGGLAGCEEFVLPDGTRVAFPALTAFAGDSTFYHSSVIRLLDAAANDTPCLYIVFDNLTVALTGCQPVPQLPTAKLAEAMGIHAKVVDPKDIIAASKAVSELLQYVREQKKPALLVAVSGCALLPAVLSGFGPAKYEVLEDKCDNCGLCVEEFYCPALIRTDADSQPEIIEDMCVGCGACEIVCRHSITIEGLPRGESAIAIDQ